MNFNVPCFSNLVSELQVYRSDDGSVVRTDYKLVYFNSRSYNGEIVQLQSALNNDYNNFSEKNQTYTTFQRQ